MAHISEFASAQKAFNERMTASIGEIKADIMELNRLITEVHASPEDKVLLEELMTRGAEIAQSLEELDALTPPRPPSTEPV